MANGEAQTVNLVLAKLGRGPGVGQDVPAEDYAAVVPHIRYVSDELSRSGVVTIPDLSDISNAYFNQFCWLVANSVSTEFDIPADIATKETTKQDIRRIVASAPTYETLKTTYF